MREKWQTGERPLEDTDRNATPDSPLPQGSVAIEDTFDGVFIFAPHLTGALPEEHPQTPLTAAGEHDSEDAMARRLASKFAPQEHRHLEAAQSRYRPPNWDGKHSIGRHDPAGARQFGTTDSPPPGRRRLFWSLCAGMLVIAGTSAAFGLVQPLNDLLPGHVNSDAKENGSGQVSVVSAAPEPTTVAPANIGGEASPPSMASSRKADLNPSYPELTLERHPYQPAVQHTIQATPPALKRPRASTTQPATGVARPATPPLSQEQIASLLSRGEKLLLAGDVVSARLLFLRVAGTGDPRGAKGVAMTYDPDIYARLPVAGLTPDREMATLWYEKAGHHTPATVTENSGPDTRHSQAVSSPERNAACAAKYRSFNPATGLYKAYSGTLRPCRLP